MKWPGSEGKYKATKLETVIKALVQRYGAARSTDEGMLDGRTEGPGACKTSVFSNSISVG